MAPDSSPTATRAQLQPYGPRAFLISGGDQTQRLRWAKQFDQTAPPGFVEWVMGYDTLLVRFSQDIAPNSFLPLLENVAPTSKEASTARHHEIPVNYSGPDLERLAAHCQLSPKEVIQLHSEATYQVRFVGFSPGFAYLDGLPEILHCPRLDSPRPRIPAGAVAIGGQHAGIYPSASPGGWNWIGNTELPLLDSKAKDRPFRLIPGDTLSFTPQ